MSRSKSRQIFISNENFLGCLVAEFKRGRAVKPFDYTIEKRMQLIKLEASQVNFWIRVSLTWIKYNYIKVKSNHKYHDAVRSLRVSEINYDIDIDLQI